MLNDQDVIANLVYTALYNQLRSYQDIDNLSELSGIPRNILAQMLGQKISRNVRNNFYKIKAQIPTIKKQWTNGESFNELANKLNFSPIMIARLILFSMGWTKNEFNSALNYPSKITDIRISKELSEALEIDEVFSPRGQARAVLAGKELEKKVKQWLEQREIKFITEKENKSSVKTPDFLLAKPEIIMGRKTYWIECKASFGDEIETRRNLNKQLSHYLNLFGPGIVVYGLGMVERPVNTQNILVVSRKMMGIIN